ncbi:MAG: hypothetical protein A4E19_14290 [Nitrospira sp. SG-bin1]|nr:MAG: hypothetical protein A4E19_14290 [Nitrospira sp. SG-bin1]
MKRIPTILGVALCGAVLFLGLSSYVQAEHAPSPSDTMKTDSLTNTQKYGFQSDDDKQRHIKEDSAEAGGAKTIRGELFRIDDAEYFVKTKEGGEVRLHTDKTTDMKGTIKKGDQVEAKINEQNHALSIRAIK